MVQVLAKKYCVMRSFLLNDWVWISHFLFVLGNMLFTHHFLSLRKFIYDTLTWCFTYMMNWPSLLETGVVVLKWGESVPSTSQDLWYHLHLRFIKIFNRPNGNWKTYSLMKINTFFSFKEKIFPRKKKVIKYQSLQRVRSAQKTKLNKHQKVTGTTDSDGKLNSVMNVWMKQEINQFESNLTLIIQMVYRHC